ncbi:MAG: 6-hydroxycyclohex-1-ene-1-carbonyl-CoA dehydrogenase [Planctomycetota bacterium]
MASWQMESPGEPLALRYGPVPEPGPGEVVLEVKACGMCHTDVSFLYQGVRTNAPLPLTLGHEIVGTAIAGADEYLGRTYIVPSVMPCGDCDLCARGRGNICRHQKMPGNDFHGGFASHFLTPARFLCEVPEGTEDVEDLSVLADAVATAYQSVLRCDVKQNDMVVVVGAGGVGTFALQTAKARGAHTVAIDVDAERLERLAEYVDLPIDAGSTPTKEIRKAVAAYEKEHGLPGISRKVLECSGTAPGQQTAYALLTFDGTLAVVGFTLDKIELRLSNLMAFDATAFGNWGCLPEHFPEMLRLLGEGKLSVKPFVERHPMSSVNDLLRAEHHARRPVLIPDFED